MKTRGAAQPETTAYYRGVCEEQACRIRAQERTIDGLQQCIEELICRCQILEISLAEQGASYEHGTRRLRNAALEAGR